MKKTNCMKSRKNIPMLNKLFAVIIVLFAFTQANAQNCLNVCPDQASLLNVTGEDASAVNAVVCIDQLTGANHIIDNGADLSILPEALYNCYTVAVSNNSGTAFDVASVTYTDGNVQSELDMALLGSDDCGAVAADARAIDINSSYCQSAVCFLDLCPCNDPLSNSFVFTYNPSGDSGTEVFLVTDASGTVVALSNSSPVSAAGLADGDYSIYSLIYDPAQPGSLATLLSIGTSLADIEADLDASGGPAFGTISTPIAASINSTDCGCQPPIDCVDEVCPCNGDPNLVSVAATGYTAGANQQWFVVVSGGVVVTTQLAAADGSASFLGLPDGDHEIYAVNYDPALAPGLSGALVAGAVWASITADIDAGTYIASYLGPKPISINGADCNCVPDFVCNPMEGTLGGTAAGSYCDGESIDLSIAVSGNNTDPEYSTILLITNDNPATADIYDIVGIADASGSFNILGLLPGDYCIHSYNYVTADFDPSVELQILNGATGLITTVDQLQAISSNDGTLPVCGAVTTTACEAFTIYPALTFNAIAQCDASDLNNFSIEVSGLFGGSGTGATATANAGTVTDNGDGTYTITNIPNDTDVTVTLSDGSCSTSVGPLTANCFTVDCPVSAIASASAQAVCSGSSISLSISDVLGTSGFPTTDYSVNWTSSNPGVDVSDPSNVTLTSGMCAPMEVTFTATVTCTDGVTAVTATTDATVYPDDISAYVTTDESDQCNPTIAVSSDCDGYVTVGPPSPGTIGPDQSGTVSWSVFHTYGGNNAPLGDACALSGAVLAAYNCAPECPTATPLNITNLEACSGQDVTLPALEDALSTTNVTGNLYATYSWTSSDGSLTSSDGSAQTVTVSNADCTPTTTTYTYSIVCDLDGSTIDSGSFDVTVYPSDISSFVQMTGGGCMVMLGPIAGCEGVISSDSFVANEGDAGSVDLTVSYTGGGPGCAADVTMSAAYDCPEVITCDPGTISGSLTAVCDGEFVVASSTGAVGPISYYLHDGSDAALGSTLGTSDNGVFTNDGSYPMNIDLCITAVPILADGTPDPACDISNCLPVVFLAPITVTATPSCDTTTGLVTMSVTFAGGGPEYLPGVHTYEVDGVGSISFGEVVTVGPVAANTAGTLIISDDGKGCTGSADWNAGPCDIEVTCSNDAGVMPAGQNKVCAGGTVNSPVAGANVDPGSTLVYVLHDGFDNNIGTILGTSTSGVFMNDGSYPQNVELYVCAIVGPPGPNGMPDMSDDCTFISQNCTPVRFLQPVSIVVTETCNEQNGDFFVFFEVYGGTPGYQPAAQYTVSGDFNGLVSQGQEISFGPIPNGNTYAIVVSDDKGCGADVFSDPIDCKTLPIELISYTGEVQAQGNYLKWQTATEIDNDYFTLERSTDGINFELIDNQSGSGTTSTPQSYDYLDRDAPNGISYYRLWQTDYDGTTAYVGIVTLVRGESSLAITSLQPIPVLENLEIVFTSIIESQVELTVYDALGRHMGTESLGATTGINSHTINVSDYAAGMYFLNITQGEYIVTEKFVKE